MTEMPTSWLAAELADACTVAPSDPPLPSTAPFVPMAAVEVGVKHPLSTEPRGDRGGIRARADDLLFARITPCLENGKVALVPDTLERVGGSTEFIVVRPSRWVEPRFLYYWSLHPLIRDYAQGRMTGTTGRMRLSPSDLAQAPFWLPPRKEQGRIVAAVEEAFSKLDAGEAGLRAVRQLLKRMRDAILTAAVTGRLVPQDPTDTPAIDRLADREILPRPIGLPSGWALATIGAAFRVAVGTTPRRNDPSLWGGDVWWVSSGEVAFNRIRSTRETVTTKALGNAGRILPPGTVLLAMIGEGKTRGQPAILDVAAAHNQNCASIRVEGTDVSSEWVYTFLASRYAETRRAGSGNNQPALNKRLVEAIEIPIPPAEEQRQIVAEVERQMSFVEACERTIDAGLARSGALRRSILKAAFEGRLVPQDPTDEPASVLLERIRSERVASPAKAKRARQKA